MQPIEESVMEAVSSRTRQILAQWERPALSDTNECHRAESAETEDEERVTRGRITIGPSWTKRGGVLSFKCLILLVDAVGIECEMTTAYQAVASGYGWKPD
jgi:hypothetical protein